MPQHKKPRSLEDLALESVSDYIAFLGKRVIFSGCSKHVQHKRCHEEGRKENGCLVLDTKVLSNFLFGSLPHIMWDKISTHILLAVPELIRKSLCTTDGFMMTGDTWCKGLVKELIMLSITPQLVCLDLVLKPKFVRKVLCENLHELVHLKSLTVRVFKTWDSTSKLFLRHLPLLQGLLSFNMERECTDAILHVIGEHCKQLQYLDVNGSFGVTNDSINSLIKLERLHELQISGTSITEGGYVELVKKISVMCHNPSSTLHTSLKKVGTGLIRNKQLILFVQTFRNVTHVSFSTMDCDLSMLNVLKNLSELKLTGGNFEKDHLKELIEERGNSFRSLDLLLFQSVDLMLIGKCCGNLETLNLRSCTFQTAKVNRRSSACFQKLEKLILYVQCRLEYLLPVLINCVNVKSVTIGLIRELDDKFMSAVLSENPMKQLTRLQIYYSMLLTLRTARLVMASCPLLSALVGIDTWRAVPEEELCAFREELTSKNWDIETYRPVEKLQ